MVMITITVMGILTYDSEKFEAKIYCILIFKNTRTAEIVDLPGHERIRGKYLKKYEDNTRCVKFINTFHCIKMVKERDIEIWVKAVMCNAVPDLL